MLKIFIKFDIKKQKEIFTKCILDTHSKQKFSLNFTFFFLNLFLQVPCNITYQFVKYLLQKIFKKRNLYTNSSFYHILSKKCNILTRGEGYKYYVSIVYFVLHIIFMLRLECFVFFFNSFIFYPLS